MSKLKSLSLIGAAIVSSLSTAFSADFLRVHPEMRKPSDVSELPENPFRKIEIVTEEVVQNFLGRYNSFINDLMEAKVGGLVWHSLSDNRRIMFADTPLREGQVFPGWLAAEGRHFRLSEINIGKLTIEHIPNGEIFHVRFTTRKSYESILQEARPNKGGDGPQGPIGGIFPSLEIEDGPKRSVPTPRPYNPQSTGPKQVSTDDYKGPSSEGKAFIREMVADRREKEDTLFFLADELQGIK